MNNTTSPLATATKRRDFLKTATVAGAGALLANLDVARYAHAAGSDTIKIAMVGCGGRGTGAAGQAIENSAGANVKLIAMADAFGENLENRLAALKKKCKDKVEVPKERQFVGLDAYKEVMATDASIVIIATPPGFRPMQFEAAVTAGKHVFMEKPVAVDAPGYRRIMAANVEAKRKNLMVAVGHHLRHAKNHRNFMQQIHEGLLGEIQYTKAYYDATGIWNRPRKPDQTEMQYQVNNWYHFVWLSGDHLVEQHVHGIDACNWMVKGHPIQAVGMGGRQVRIQKDIGELYDHHNVQYTYANGMESFSECRHIPKCWNKTGHTAVGTKGSIAFETGDGVTVSLKGQEIQRLKGGPDGHQLEWDDFFAALLAGKIYNEAEEAADSTMTAILGRMATYSGRLITWDEAVKSELSYAPARLAWDAEPKSKPGPDGVYPCAIPGVTVAL